MANAKPISVPVAAIAITALVLAAYNLHLIAIPFPLEPREGAPVLFTRILLEGGNPYTFDHLPAHTNVYGVLYNAIMWPIAAIFGPTFAVHRAVAAIFLLMSVALLYAVMVRLGASRTLAFALALTWWAQNLASTTPHARVDSIGLFLFMLAVNLPYLMKFSRVAYFIAILASIAAFYAKQYFLLAGIIEIGLATLAHGILFGVILSVSSAALMMVSFAIVDWYLPFYFESTILIGGRSFYFDSAFLWNEVLIWTRENPFLIAAIGVSLFAGFQAVVKPNRAPISIPFRSRLSYLAITYHHLIFALASLPFVLRGMGHVGNIFVYATHLLTPALFCALVPFARARPRGWLPGLAYIGLIWSVTGLPLRQLPGDQARWEEWRSILAEKNDIYYPPIFAVLLDDLGKPIYDAGQAGYFEYAVTKSTLGNSGPVKLHNEWRTHIETNLRNGGFDLVIQPTTTEASEILKFHQLVKTLSLPSRNYHVRQWDRWTGSKISYDLYSPR